MFFKTLFKGARGKDVFELQSMLLTLGFKLPNYGADGIFGDETEKAVMDFQYTYGIQVDGIVGPETRRALEEAYSLYQQGKWDPQSDPLTYPVQFVSPEIKPVKNIVTTPFPAFQAAGFGKYLLIGGAIILGAFLLKSSRR